MLPLCSELSPLRQQFTLLTSVVAEVLWPDTPYGFMCRSWAAEEAAGGSRRRCPASTRVLRCCVQPRTRYPAGRRSPERLHLVLRGAQARWPLRGRAQASYGGTAAGQPQGSSGGHSSGGLRGSPKPRPMMVITIVGHVATVSPGVKINGSASVCTRPGAQWSCRNRHQGEGSPERAHTGPGRPKPR